jgi:ribosomal protein S18 acetylase RimI-like enzyme
MRLHDIYVDEAARGQGAGRMLMEAVVTEAKEFGAAKILLSVAVMNTLARTFSRPQASRKQWSK